MIKNIKRIIFMGTPQFAVPSLKALVEQGENIAGVVTQPDRPKGRGRKLTPPPVKLLALEAGIPIFQAAKIKTAEFHKTLEKLQPDLIIVVAYGRILPANILNLPKYGVINVHGSLLPKYRGAAPVQWAVIRGERETGVTVMEVDEGLDTGDMLLNAKLAVSPDDTAGSLAVKMAELGGKTLAQALNLMRKGQLPPQKQDDSLATLAPPLKKEQGIIDWSKPAQEIDCLIRGLDPWPMAWTTYNDKWLRLMRPMVIQETSGEKPGVVCRADKKGLLISCGQESLFIREVQLQGAKRMDVASFLCGHALKPGYRFGG
jgi:methionyl-tRNA formyltransferase